MIAEHLGITENTVNEALKNSSEILSLDSPISSDGDTTLGEFLEDKSSEAKTIENRFLKDSINRSIGSHLTQREASVIRLRFGLDDGIGHSLEDVGARFNVTRERIRQIEVKALRKLRHPSHCKDLRDFLYE